MPALTEVDTEILNDIPLTRKYMNLPNCISRYLGQTEVLLSVYIFFLILFPVQAITMAAMHLQTVEAFLSGMSFFSPFSIFSINFSRKSFDT